MRQMIELSQLTMKRLINYQRVVENQARSADRRQWTKMKLDNMNRSEAARKRAARMGAIVAYSGCLFRIQNKMPPYRQFREDVQLHNGLVELMDELNIPTSFVNVDIPSDGDLMRR